MKRSVYAFVGAAFCGVCLIFASCDSVLEDLLDGKDEPSPPAQGDTTPDDETGPGGDDPDDPSDPGVPASLEASVSRSLACTLSWSAPPPGTTILVVEAPDGGVWLPAEGSTYEAGTTSGGARILYAGTGVSVARTGLEIGKTYTFLAFGCTAEHAYSAAKSKTITVERPAPTFAGYDFALSEGTFWFYDYYSVSGSYGSYFRYHSYFPVLLRAPRQIAGKTGYPVTTESVQYAPRWSYLALENGVFYGSTDGASWTVVFDANTGSWKGGGFFVQRDANSWTTAATRTRWENQTAVQVEAVGASSFTSETGYTYVDDYGYVSDGNPTIISNTAEYFRPGYGPWGFDDSFSYTDSYTYQSSTFKSVYLKGSSLQGDTLEDPAVQTTALEPFTLTGTGNHFAEISYDWQSRDPSVSLTYVNASGTSETSAFFDFYSIPAGEDGTVHLTVQRLVGNPDTTWPAFRAVVFRVTVRTPGTGLVDLDARSAVRPDETRQSEATARGSLTLPNLETRIFTEIARIENEGSRKDFLGNTISLDQNTTSFAVAAGSLYLIAVQPAGDASFRYLIRR